MNREYNPDVLNCIANLSNDEVFTPPQLANQVLDMLPQELFSSPDTTFLDPFCKSGVFLREIVKRLDRGLANAIPNRQKRIDHILHKQVFGIALTELTSLLSRRTLYCSKSANSEHSVSYFDNPQGHILYTPLHHTWQNGKCKYCGASREVYDRGTDAEQYAYQFIHTDNPSKIFNMTFDVIIGNPPYQLSFGLEGANSSNAKSIYNLFISQAILLAPRYLVMITPSRWMTKTSQGIPESWVDEMLSANHFRVVHDFESSNDFFPGVSIMGGVSYFLWEKDYIGTCIYHYHYSGNKKEVTRVAKLDAFDAGIVVRDPQSYMILEKIIKIEGDYFQKSENNFEGLVSPKHYFDDSTLLTSNWNGYRNVKDNIYSIKYYLNIHNERTYRWIAEKQIPKNRETKNLHKVYIPAANGSMDFVLGKPFYGEPNSVCSQTYLVIGYNANLSKIECENIISYIKTRFFRYLVGIKKKTQNGPRGVYQFVPLQDFSHPWTDEMLYSKYRLSSQEIAFIESMIRPMD